MNTDSGSQTSGGIPTERRFDVLLGALILLMLAAPLTYQIGPAMHPNFGRITIATIFVLMLLATVFAIGKSRKMLCLTTALAAPVICLELIIMAVDSSWIAGASHIFTMLFLCFSIVIILKFVFSSGYVSYNRLCAALCVYLLLGIFWASTFSLIDTITPGSFISTHGDEQKIQPMCFGDKDSIYPLYFSFVTMTTLGYGDIVPVLAMAKMCAIIEAVTGQLYLTVLVARLVGIHIAQSVSNAKPE